MGGLLHWFGAGDDYVRPAARLERGDLVVVLVMFFFAAINRELNRPLLSGPVGVPVWGEYLALVTGVAALAFRRIWPMPVTGYLSIHFYVTCVLVPEVGYTLGYQAIVFFAIYSGAAWARDRQVALIVIGAIALGLFGWLAWDLAVGSGMDSLREQLMSDAPTEDGLLPPIVSAVLLNYIFNAVYLGGAVLLGRNAWRRARDSQILRAQAETLSSQATELQRQAVVDERLRIARELHDVVAHHVSVMGIQAGAARTLLDRDPAASAEALTSIEESSRIAVSEMRGLLGALRGASGEQDVSRAPEPTLAELPALFAEAAASGVEVDYSEVVELPDGLAGIPLPLQLSAYRIIQEALTNVGRHSTARQAKVVLRAVPDRGPQAGWVEVEITDDGRPRPGTGGSGLGQLGMRERVTSHGGVAEIGPRLTGGYRVRVRLPLTRRTAGALHG